MQKPFVVLVTALAVSAAFGPLSAQSTAQSGAAQATPTPQATPSPTPAAPSEPKPAAASPKGEIIQKVIVKVNGEIFTQSELEFRQIQALRDQQKAARKEDLNTDPALIKALSAVTPDILLQAVDELMLIQHGREMGLKITDAIYERAIDQLKQSNKITDDATFQQALKSEGMTLADLKVSIEHSWLMNEVQQRELMRNMTLTEEEARKFYDSHKELFMKPATVTLREIVINVPNQTVGGQVSFNVNVEESIKEKITALRERALKGEDFAKLASEASDAASKDSGGLIGSVEMGNLSASLAEIVSKMKPGDITEPLRLKTGFQILKLDQRTDAAPEAFERSRDRITKEILESRLDVETDKFLEKLRAQAVIEWKDDGFKKMYDAARAARKAGPNGK